MRCPPTVAKEQKGQPRPPEIKKTQEKGREHSQKHHHTNKAKESFV